MTDPTAEVADVMTPAPVGASGPAAFIANLKEGARLACLLRPTAGALHFSWGQILALVALNWAIDLAAQMAYVGLDGRFQSNALPDSLFIVPELLLAWLLGRIAAADRPSGNAAASVGHYLVGLLALGIPATLAVFAYFLAYPHLEPRLNVWLLWGIGYLPLLWYIVAAVLASVRLPALRGMRALAGAVAAIALLLTPQLALDNDSWVWTPRPKQRSAEPERDYFAPAREDNIYRQSQLLADTLARIEPGRPGQVDLYFVGAAGYASQDVFMREVNSVTTLLDERFDTRGRSLKLINNEATIKEVPIASRTALKRAFGRIAEVMNRDEDILFLYMTSHGSHDHRFSLDFGTMRFDELDPTVLRRLLDDAGIKRRVIVVSACYSGGFVDALKNDDTLVITAAAADRNSFGCDNENDYTYFGKAYFDEALRRTYSFVEAFDLAKPAIAAREKKDDYTPSDPQISIGKDIAPVLEAYARDVAMRAGPHLAVSSDR
ncbi:MAG: peptidase C13 [Rhodocyclaceae bacterium]|nr:peptidase C13 [Rhodocyclaceae bacterium]